MTGIATLREDTHSIGMTANTVVKKRRKNAGSVKKRRKNAGSEKKRRKNAGSEKKRRINAAKTTNGKR